MGYRIWRKDKEWNLAFDEVFDTKESVDARIAELHAIYHTQFRLGQLSFHPYLEDIKLSKNGSVIQKSQKSIPVRKHKPRR